jgi:1-acyl-sn-glycerol-3-phosphate acyltransferase
MKSLLAYPLSVIYYFTFGSCLIIFHGFQWICYYGLGYKAHKISVDLLNFFILRCLNLLGTQINFKLPKNLPQNRSLILVCNHQSTYDIPPIIWYLRKFHPKFISKKELGSGIPSVSFNLRHGGSVMIDRKKPKLALGQIQKFGERLHRKNQSAVIFPEGTRSKDGKKKKFQRSGLVCLFKSMPDALVVPISIGNSWKFGTHKYFPMPLGVKIQITAHEPLIIDHKQPQEFIEHLEKFIQREVEKKQKK